MFCLDGCPLFCFREESGGWHPHRLADAVKRVDGDIAPPALHQRHVRAVQPTTVGQLLLAQALREAVLPNGPSEPRCEVAHAADGGGAGAGLLQHI